MPTLHLLIKGDVQGVFFRATAKETAVGLGVTGWIKNTPSGEVEAVVTGTEKQIQAFVAWCRQGPKRAKVSELISTQKEDTLFTDFSVIKG